MLTPPQLLELEENGSLQFSHEECAIILGVESISFCKIVRDRNSPEYIAYERGRLRSSAEIRKAILTQAKNGSSPAQKQMIDLIESNHSQNQTGQASVCPALFIFQDRKLAAEIYKNKKLDGLFVVAGEFMDADGNKRLKIARVEKIDGMIQKSKKGFDVYDDDLKEIYTPPEK